MPVSERMQKLIRVAKKVAARRRAAKQGQPSQRPKQDMSPASGTLTPFEIERLRNEAMDHLPNPNPEKVALDLATLESKRAAKQ